MSNVLNAICGNKLERQRKERNEKKFILDCCVFYNEEVSLFIGGRGD